jgi:DNA photolyase
MDMPAFHTHTLCCTPPLPQIHTQGAPSDTLPQLVASLDAGLLVTDYSPLRLGREWRDAVTAAVQCPVAEVDAHNVVPVWVASDKREYAARTLRPKIHARLPEFLVEFPAISRPAPWPEVAQQPPAIDWQVCVCVCVCVCVRARARAAHASYSLVLSLGWDVFAWCCGGLGCGVGRRAGRCGLYTKGLCVAHSPALFSLCTRKICDAAQNTHRNTHNKCNHVVLQALFAEVRRVGAAVPEVTWAVGGEDAAAAALLGESGFLSPGRLKLYATKRNDPSQPQARGSKTSSTACARASNRAITAPPACTHTHIYTHTHPKQGAIQVSIPHNRTPQQGYCPTTCATHLQALSNLSPWLHFGQLSPQRAALEAAKLRSRYKESVEGFLDELVRTPPASASASAHLWVGDCAGC